MSARFLMLGSAVQMTEGNERSGTVASQQYNRLNTGGLFERGRAPLVHFYRRPTGSASRLRELSQRLKLMFFFVFKKLTAQKQCRRFFEGAAGAYRSRRSLKGVTICYALLISNAGFYHSRRSLKGGNYLLRPSNQQC